jgi:hypothetical protein
MEPEIDLVADLNAEDDEGLGWSVLSEARDRSQVCRGVMLVAGNDQAKAVVRIVAVDDDGQVHFTILPGSLEKNRHLIGPPWPNRRPRAWRAPTDDRNLRPRDWHAERRVRVLTR